MMGEPPRIAIVERDITNRYVRARVRRARAQVAFDDEVPVIVTDGYGRILRATRAARELLGAQHEKLVGKRFVYRVAGEDRGALGRILDSLRAQGGNAAMRATLRPLRGVAFETELEFRGAADDVGPLVVVTIRSGGT